MLNYQIVDKFLVIAGSKHTLPACLSDLLFKMGARVTYHARGWYVHVASALHLAHHYRAVLAWGS